MKFDLTSMNRKELEKLKTSVEKALAKLAEKDRKAARAAAEKAAAAHGFSLAEITGDVPVPKAAKGKAGAKAKSAPKYKNPADPSQTWTGKGRKPEWFKAAMAEGTPPEALQI